MAGSRLDVDAISWGDDLGMEVGPVGKQAIVGIALKLLNIGIVVRSRHGDEVVQLLYI